MASTSMSNKPTFTPGRNLAMKVPSHEYEETVAFYRDILSLQEIDGECQSSTESNRFEFGDKVLWIDRVPALSQSELWLEIITNDVDRASTYLAEQGIVRRDEIEVLPDSFKGFWISSPSNMIHLISESSD